MHTAPWQRTAAGAGLLGADGRLSPTIFSEMTALATSTGAVNLGQGFPDEDGPRQVLDAAKEAIDRGLNQYGPGRGSPDLIDAIVEHQQRFYGIDVDPDGVVITAGATEALAATMLAYLAPGDEVVVFEPYYDAYVAVAALAGATVVPVPLESPNFEPDPDRLQQAVSARTRMIVVNSPHNPTGAVFSRETLTHILRIGAEVGALIVTDEVYEHLVYSGRHIPIAAIADDRDRLVSISSGGKTFSVTGWKIGWIMTTPARVAEIAAVKQFLTFVNGAPLQPAIAAGLRLPDEHFAVVSDAYARKRDVLTTGLQAAGFDVLPARSGYFLLADAAPLGIRDAREFARQLPGLVGVVGVPLSALAKDSRTDLQTYMRFAFCKSDATLEQAASRLAGLGDALQAGRAQTGH